MSPSLSRRALALAAAAGLGLLTTTALATAAAAAAPPSTTTLPGEVVRDLASAADHGAVDASAPMRVAVAMAVDTAGRDRAYRSMVTPGSPRYGQFLTPAQFNTEFGVSSGSAQRVLRAVTAHGLKVKYASPDGSYVLLGGTAGQVDRTFGVTERHYTRRTGQAFTANNVAPTVPTGVTAVLGLTSLPRFTVANGKARARAAAPAQDACLPGRCTGTLTPPDLWSVYEQPSTDRGAGQKVAIFGEGKLDQVVSNLRTFEKTFGLPTVPVRRVLVGDDGTDNAGQGEWDLDSDASTGMAPDLAELDYYFGSDLSDASIGGTYSAWANDPSGPLTGNSSFGGPEAQEYLGGFILDRLLQQAAMEGRTMFVSSGDAGGSCLPGANGVSNQAVPCVEYPASSPYVVGVGGTVLYTNTTTPTGSTQAQPATRNLEKNWEYSGGGVSNLEPAPGYQVAAFPGGVGVPCGAGPGQGKTCRGVPDVAAVSGDIVTNGYAVISGTNTLTASGGTSLSSPLWAGMWSRVQAAHPSACGSSTTLGFAQPLLYGLGNDTTRDPLSFFDVGGTTASLPGSNGQQVTMARSTVDPAGYDFITGLGTPRITGIARALDCGNTTAVATNTPPASLDVTTSPTVTGCAPNGTLTDPAGDQFPATGTDAFDLRTVRLSSAGRVITFATTVTNLAAAPGTIDYATEFVYGTSLYAVTADHSATGDTFGLYLLATQVTPIGVGAQSAPTLLASLSGTVDTATNAISVLLPFDTFNAHSGQTTPLQAGSTLAKITVFTQAGPATTALPADFDNAPVDQANFFNCSYQVAAIDIAPTALPEGAYVALLPVTALVAGAGVLLIRRRRVSATG